MFKQKCQALVGSSLLCVRDCVLFMQYDTKYINSLIYWLVIDAVRKLQFALFTMAVFGAHVAEICLWAPVDPSHFPIS